MIKINSHIIPAKLESLIEANLWVVPKNALKLQKISGFDDITKVKFMKPEEMDKNTKSFIKFYNNDEKELFEVNSISNANISQKKYIFVENTVVIAASYCDDYILLIYENTKKDPSVYVSDWTPNKNRWKKIANTFNEFYNEIINS